MVLILLIFISTSHLFRLLYIVSKVPTTIYVIITFVIYKFFQLSGYHYKHSNLSEFSTPELADGLSLESDWQKILSLQDSSQ